MSKEINETNFHGVFIDENLLMDAFSVERETAKQIRIFFDRMKEANVDLTKALRGDDPVVKDKLLEIQNAISRREVLKMLPELSDRGLYVFSNTITNGLELVGDGPTVVEDTKKLKEVEEPEEPEYEVHPLTVHKQLVEKHIDTTQALNTMERQGYVVAICCINFFFDSLQTAMDENRINVDKALRMLECRVVDYQAYIEANIPNEIDGINVFRSIIATLVPDVWILGENKQGELTMKPFSKGIPGWSELIEQQEHIVLEEFKGGTGPMRIDWLAHLI